METAHLLLGTNLGDRAHNLAYARRLLNEIGSITAASPVYVTAAWGITDQPEFYNQAIALSTRLDPEMLLNALCSIEIQAGRKDSIKWGPRILDIDILFFGNIIIESERLTIPHPRIHERRFALVPLNFISPNLIDPKSGKTVEKLLEDCDDKLPVRLAEC
jgi:2-amino-4-hydroxy-6-hydroxymethyldihydropteridine diphosphokinase